ncbi:MAG: UDP-4-amino-4,6-dideoxy-N-acetyl-beta-L-altrosamine transaminase [Calditrichaeota bacterium]|nr:MAG: UDP-4-amino-4,6-dideoxy-N-acetyl-beta-L-altrosamine transaminase [Calditrichota bacterium]
MFKFQIVESEDIQAVIDVLKSDWLTTGPRVKEFERALAEFVGTKEAVVVSNGTAALHTMVSCLDIQEGDEVLIPTMTFVATANCIVYRKAKPVFVDVNPETLLIDLEDLERKLSPRTRAIIAVDYAGQPCDYEELKTVAQSRNITLLADACHALGGKYQGQPVGSLATASTFSFHAVKNITTGEGGAITTDDVVLARKMRIFRNHGISEDHHQRDREKTWVYQMTDLGFNYRLTDFQCALGISQLKHLPQWIERRNEIAERYNKFFARVPYLEPLKTKSGVLNAYHLYVVKLNLEQLKISREMVYREMKNRGLAVNVHYIPVHLQPYYREHFDTGPGLCPRAEWVYERILSLPVSPAMTNEQVDLVASTLLEILESNLK